MEVLRNPSFYVYINPSLNSVLINYEVQGKYNEKQCVVLETVET